MMKMIITWKNEEDTDFHVKQEQVKAEFKKQGLMCVDIKDNVTEIRENGLRKDFARIWNSIFHLNEHKFFYDVVEKCIWYDGKLLEDVIEECKEDIANGELIVHE